MDESGKKKEYKRIRREKLRAAGLCLCCGKNPPRDGISLCEACSEYMNGKAKERIARLKAAGLCTYCGKVPPMQGKTYCFSCAVRRSEYSRKYYNRRRERDKIDGS